MSLEVVRMPRELALHHLPYTVVKLVNGAEVRHNYHGCADVVSVYFNNQEEVLHKDDFELVKKVADRVWKEHIQANKLETVVPTVPTALEVHAFAYRLMEQETSVETRKRVLMLLSDQYGCGYWRMMLPSDHLDEKAISVDVSSNEVIFEYLREYDTIAVQRICDWNSFYIVKKLKKLGKRIIYDIDDNLFELPQFHPAFDKFGPDKQEAARAILHLSDTIVVTTPEMGDSLCKNVGLTLRNKIVVIPNAINCADFPVKKIYPASCPDSLKPFRIMWAGSATHEHDFRECAHALDLFLAAHKEVNMRVLFMGYLPVCVRQFAQGEHWKGRIEFVDFKNVETYFSMLHKVYADLAVAPLAELPFNQCKSNIKWIEYTMAGVPVVASDVVPYKNTIKHGETGLLVANSAAAWLEVFEDKFANRKNEKWQTMVDKARKVVDETYDITKVVSLWNEVYTK